MNVAVVGLGKLGLPMAALFAAGGHNVIGFDRSEAMVAAVNDRVDPHHETGLAGLLRRVESIRATTDFSAIAAADIIFIVVPTPSDSGGRFMNDHILEVIATMGPYLRDRWRTVVVASTIMPGTMATVVIPALEAATGRWAGTTIGAAYSPEFIALGSVLHDMVNPDFVLVGSGDQRSLIDVVMALSVVVAPGTVVAEVSHLNAEIAKIALNAFVTMKISYANTLAEICESMAGADAKEVSHAVGLDSRIGKAYLTPGGPFGGPCFPRDSVAFATFSPDQALALATQEVNEHQIWRLACLLMPFNTVAILGLAYKPGTTVTEQSLGVRVAEVLTDVGVTVVWHDPLVTTSVLGDLMTAEAAVAGSEAVLLALVAEEYVGLDYGDRYVVDVWRQLPERANTFVIGVG